MNPDEVKLALWLEDELQGEERSSFDAWASAQPEHLAAREEIRSWKKSISGAIPADEAPPFADFFNSRIQQAIRDPAPAVSVATAAPATSFWKNWLMPASAFAGMALAFWVGTRAQPAPASVTSSAPSQKGDYFQPMVYTPDGGVNAVWTSGDDASVIVLEGVTPIPDATDFSETVQVPMEREIDSTAGRENPLPAN